MLVQNEVDQTSFELLKFYVRNSNRPSSHDCFRLQRRLAAKPEIEVNRGRFH
jgi:hypothetical protein